MKVIESIENDIGRYGGISGDHLVRDKHKKTEKVSQGIGLWDKPLGFLKKIFPKPNLTISGRVVEVEAIREGSGFPVTE